MVNVTLDKTSGSAGQTVVQVTPDAYIGKNDATKEIVFTNAKGSTAKLTCLFKGTGDYVYDNPVITEVTAPNFPAAGGTKQLQFSGYQIYRETSDGEEVGRLEFTQDTIADGFIINIESISSLPSDITLSKREAKATVESKGTITSSETIKLTVNLSVYYNGKGVTKQNIVWKQDANKIINTEFVSWHSGFTGFVKTIEVGPETGSYDIDSLANIQQTFSSESVVNTTGNGTLTVSKSVTGWTLTKTTLIYPANTTTDDIDGVYITLSGYGQSISLRFTLKGLTPAITITPVLLTFESGSTTPQNVVIDSTDSWTAK